jgi:acetyl-CoA acetyltransferase
VEPDFNSLKDKAAIVGIGEIPFVKGDSGKSPWAMGLEACYKAVQDAGLSVQDIDGIMEPLIGASVEDFRQNWDLPDIKFVSRFTGGGAAQISQMLGAVLAVTSGLCKYVVCHFAWKGGSTQRISRGIGSPDLMLAMSGVQLGSFIHKTSNWNLPFGDVGPGSMYSPWARYYMEHHGLKREHLGMIAVTCRKHAQLNDIAIRKKPMTLEDYMAMPILMDPFCLYDFSQETDAAGAFVVTTAERARDLKQKPVYIMGVAEGKPPGGNDIANRDAPYLRHDAAHRFPTYLDTGHKWAFPRAYEMAGITPKDLDFAQIYDGFTYIFYVQIPGLMQIPLEEAGDFIADGAIELGGRLPCNTHGGLLSQGHCWGVHHIIEAVRQLRGTAGPSQVKNAEIGAVTGTGDSGDGSVAFLRR